VKYITQMPVLFICYLSLVGCSTTPPETVRKVAQDSSERVSSFTEAFTSESILMESEDFLAFGIPHEDAARQEADSMSLAELQVWRRNALNRLASLANTIQLLNVMSFANPYHSDTDGSVKANWGPVDSELDRLKVASAYLYSSLTINFDQDDKESYVKRYATDDIWLDELEIRTRRVVEYIISDGYRSSVALHELQRFKP
jgi:hypothetical protein